MRIAGSASAVLVGLYLADLANRGFRVTAALAGTLGAISFAAELIGAVPLGLASDAIAPRALMTGGALLGAVATQLFGITSRTGVFFISRTLEGVGAAGVAPSLLAHLTDVTDGNPSLRARVMSYFELSLWPGLRWVGSLPRNSGICSVGVPSQPLPRFTFCVQAFSLPAGLEAVAMVRRKRSRGSIGRSESRRCNVWLLFGSALTRLSDCGWVPP